MTRRLDLTLDGYTAAATRSATRQMQDIITKGIKTGTAPAVIARRLSAAVSTVTSGRALSIARTEMMVAQWEATQADFARDGLVQEWQWLAQMGIRTCVVCRAMHGTRHPKAERLESHPNCRCAMAPVVAGVAAIPDALTGEALFKALSWRQQREILGDARYAVYRQTKSLGSMVTRTSDPVYGGSRVLGRLAA